jgi:hypothetical protein
MMTSPLCYFVAIYYTRRVTLSQCKDYYNLLSLSRNWAALTLWHAFEFLGLRLLVSPSFLLSAWWPPLVFLVKIYYLLSLFQPYIKIYVHVAAF